MGWGGGGGGCGLICIFKGDKNKPVNVAENVALTKSGMMDEKLLASNTLERIMIGQ